MESRIDAFRTSLNPVSQAELQELSVEVAKLAKSLSDATGSLPSYDQRQYEQQLNKMEVAVADLRAASIPKAKFAFKRKAPVASFPLATSALPISEMLTQTPSIPQTSTSNLVLSSRSFEYVAFESLPRSILQQDLTISNLDHCIVNLIPPTLPVKNDVIGQAQGTPSLDVSALHVRNLTDTVLILPPIDGSVLLHDLSRCTLILGCHQFRMHASNNVDVFLSIPSNPVIEHCSDVRFSEYPISLAPSLNQKTSKHLSVQDFSHIRSTPSPHWSILSDEDRRIADLVLTPLGDGIDISYILQKLLPHYP